MKKCVKCQVHASVPHQAPEVLTYVLDPVLGELALYHYCDRLHDKVGRSEALGENNLGKPCEVHERPCCVSLWSANGDCDR